MKSARRVAENDVNTSRLRRGERVEQHRAGIRALDRADDLALGAVCPNFKLIRRRRAERVRRAQQYALALALQTVGDLADGRGLAHAVHADDQHDARLGRQVKRGVAHVQLFNQNIAQRLLHIVAALDALLVHDVAQLFHRVVRDRCAEVGHNEAVLKLVIEFVVNGLPHDGVEPCLFDLCKNTHLFLLALYSLMLSSFAMSFILIVSTLLTPRSCIVTP